MKINYIKLINWIWLEVPHLEGYKASYMTLFLAIIDSINRNNWSPVNLPYDYVINKCRIDKRVYLTGRKWLADNQLIELTSGKNNSHMARFYIGSAVGKRTSNATAEDADMDSQRCGNAPADPPADPHINKPETSNPSYNKRKKPNIPFEDVWELYGDERGRTKSKEVWESLSDEQRTKAIENIPKYKANKALLGEYLHKLENYLKDKIFDDPIKPRLNGKHHSTTMQINTTHEHSRAAL
jgi:hypothetical protein